MGCQTKVRMKLILQELSTRQFLLTNAMTSPSTGKLTFRIPIHLLHDSVAAIGDFPFIPPDEPADATHHPASWSGPTLFIKGAQSKYINNRNLPIARAMFLNMRLETLDTGHWVHAEKPAETVNVVAEFIESIE